MKACLWFSFWKGCQVRFKSLQPELCDWPALSAPPTASLRSVIFIRHPGTPAVIPLEFRCRKSFFLTVAWPRKRRVCSSRWCWTQTPSGFCVEVRKEAASGERCTFFHSWLSSSLERLGWPILWDPLGSSGILQGWKIVFAFSCPLGHLCMLWKC